MFRLKRPFSGNTDIVGLVFGKGGQIDPNSFQMQTGNLLIEVFRQDVDLVFVLITPGPQFNLRQEPGW